MSPCISYQVASSVIFEDTVSVQLSPPSAAAIEGFGYDADRDFFVIYLQETLNPGTAVTVLMDFVAELNADLSGFYRSSYVDEASGDTRELAITQFQVLWIYDLILQIGMY